MKKLKKIMSLLLAVVLLVCSATVPARADVPETKTYKYVAFGDSITAGFGLRSPGLDFADDPALILTEDLIANPVCGAYPYVFGEFLASLGEEKGVETQAVNLATTAYRAVDISRTIRQEGFKGEIAEWILETFSAEGASAPLAKYHEIFMKYLQDADLVSVELGGNDIIMAALMPMMDTDNPILNAIAMSMALTLFGTDMKTALGGGLLKLQSGKDKITVKSFVEAAKVFGNVGKNAENLVVNSANEVKGVVEAVKEVNASADIALLGMFNPYGNSLEYQGKTRDLCAVVTGIFKGSAELLIGSLIGQVDEEAAVEAANEAAAGFNLEQDADSEDTAKGLSKAIKNLEKCVKQVVAKGKLKMQSLVEKLKPYVNVVVNEISYPLQYLTLGKNVTPQMLSLNEKLAAIAEEFGITYVDVYGISNEQNLDPHPDENGHREIAEILFATISDTVAAGMDAMTVTLDQEKTEIIAGNTTQLKASVDVTWTSDNPDVAEVDKSGVVTAKGLGKTIIRAITKKGAEALCNVTVLSKYVYECEKDGIYRYTAKTSVVKKLKKAGWSYKKVMRVPAAGKKVYYIQDKTTKKFRYTSSLALAKKMKKAGNKAGVAFYQSLRKTTPVYEYSDGAENETFRYAATSSAREQLLAEGYTEVGIAWYALPKAA